MLNKLSRQLNDPSGRYPNLLNQCLSSGYHLAH